MTDSSAWTSARIREAFIYDGGEAEYHDPIHGAQTQRHVAGEIFDKWLAERDRLVFTQGFSAAWQATGEGWNGEYPDPIFSTPDSAGQQELAKALATRELVHASEADPT